jgi:hypothetical protein
MIPDPDKPLNCGRTPYATSKTCTFDVRNDGAAAVTAVIALMTPQGPSAFTITSPVGTPVGGPISIGKGATQTVTITFTPPNEPPLETMFTGGVLITAGTGTASGRALCGIGFRNPAASDAPPAGTTLAPLACP